MVEEISTLRSKIVYENNWMKLREDKIQYSDGHQSIYGYVDKAEFFSDCRCAFRRLGANGGTVPISGAMSAMGIANGGMGRQT